MPKGTKVSRCVQNLMKQGKSKSSAIAICQDSTDQSYQTGKKLKKGGRVTRRPKRRISK